MLSLSYIRKFNFLNHKKRIKNYINVDISNWYKNPYTCFKSRYYNEISSLIVYFLQYTKITPNFLTLIYVLLGLLTGFFLASNNQTLILISLVILFSKNALDWADGLLARFKKKETSLGELLDNWAGHVITNSYLCGLGVYLYNKNEEIHFIFLIIIILLLKMLDLKDYAYHFSMYKILHSKEKKKLIKKANKNKYGTSKYLFLIKVLLQNFLDERSRTIDFICLLIFIDVFYLNVTWLDYIYYLITLRVFALFCGGFYITYFKNFLGNMK